MIIRNEKNYNHGEINLRDNINANREKMNIKDDKDSTEN